MGSNIEKALSLGVSVMLLVLAFSVFFSGYTKLVAYINQGNKRLEEDNPVISRNQEIFREVKGSEVLHQVAHIKEHTMLQELGISYYNQTWASQETAVFINGVEASSVYMSGISPEDIYTVRYEFNPSGRVRAVYYDLAYGNVSED